MSNPNPDTRVLDIKFAIAACAIGGSYAAIISLIGWLVGKEAAGVAGVSLTALATALFKQFETLQFRASEQQGNHVLYVEKLIPSYAVLASLAFLGIQFLASIAAARSGLIPDIPDMEDCSFWALLQTRFLWSFAVLNLLCNLIGGYICGRAAPTITYSYAVIASVAASAIGAVGSGALFATTFGEFIAFFKQSGALFGTIFWLLYALFALLGARLALRRKPIPTDLAAHDAAI